MLVLFRVGSLHVYLGFFLKKICSTIYVYFAQSVLWRSLFLVIEGFLFIFYIINVQLTSPTASYFLRYFSSYREFLALQFKILRSGDCIKFASILMLSSVFYFLPSIVSISPLCFNSITVKVHFCMLFIYAERVLKL